jgi:sugar/nucleoside kinase (ribokinase family)
MLSAAKSSTARAGFDVVSIGAATVDIFVKSPDLRFQNNTLTIPASYKSEMSQSLICSGGGGTNSSASFSRLNLKSACVSLVGTDPLGQYVLEDLNKYQVNSDLLVRPPDETTDYSVILIGTDGSRSIITNRGSTRLESAQIKLDKLAQTDWFYITSLEGNLELIEMLIGFASEHSIKVSLNPGNRELSDLNRLIPLLSHLDFLLLNRLESETLVGIEINQPNYWEKLLSFGARITAVTDGRNGAYILTSTEKLYSPIINTRPVDETGAGDAFGSTFVGGLIHHLSLSDALFWGIKNSASVVSTLGAKIGLLNLAEIKS